MHTIGIKHRTTLRALWHNDDTTSLRLAYSTLHEACQLVNISWVFRNNSSLSTTGNSRVLSQETCITPHHFNEEDSFMALRSIANTVYTLHDSIHRRIVTNGTIRSIEVVINRSRQSNATEIILLCELHSTRQRAITAYHNQSINTFRHKIVVSCLSAFHCCKCFRACSL